MLYKEFIIQQVKEAINEELSSAVSYQIMAEKLSGQETRYLSDELKHHATEEFEHYNSLLSYASKFGFINEISPRLIIEFMEVGSTKEEIIAFNLKAETDASNRYRKISNQAKQVGDVYSADFFEDLLEKEIEHFDDIAVLVGKTREFLNSEIEVAVKNSESLEPIEEKSKIEVPICKHNNGAGCSKFTVTNHVLCPFVDESSIRKCVTDNGLLQKD